MRTIFEAVRLIDGVADVAREDVDVVIDDDRIAAVEPHRGQRSPEADATVVDGRGRTLLPGLIDAHAHYTFDPTEGSIATIARRPDAEIVLAAAGHAARALHAGVTTARGAGSIRNLEVAARGPRRRRRRQGRGLGGGHADHDRSGPGPDGSWRPRADRRRAPGGRRCRTRASGQGHEP